MDFGIPLYRVLYDEEEKVRKMWYGYQPLCLATSKDGITWDDEMAEARIAAAKPNIKWDHPEDHRTEFYGMDVFPYEGLLLGLLWIFDASMEMNRVPEDVPLKWGRTNQDGPMQAFYGRGRRHEGLL